MIKKIPVGISSCLLGHQVRFDGGHKKNDTIMQTLGAFFEFIPFCPEMASGMGTPRPSIQLIKTGHGLRCVGVKDHNLDVTDQLRQCSENQHDWLQNLCGYILKKDSPSCGMERVKVYTKDHPTRVGTGIFSQYIKDNFPLLPIEEEDRLGDFQLRENFIQRVYIMQRWQQLNTNGLSLNKLIDFHSRHKLIVMSHDQNLARALEELATSATQSNLQQIGQQYGKDLMQCLKITATRGNHVNVLQHIQGYLKTLDQEEKNELIETIEGYRLGYLPLIEPIILLRHHFRRMPNTLRSSSFYMTCYLEELAILNSI